MMDLEFSPTGEIELGTGHDDEGTPHVAMRFAAEGTDRHVVITFRFDHFVALSDHMQSVASELITQGFSRSG